MSGEVRMPRGWKAVPMPPQIAALPREPRRGFPIPHVAEWSHGDHTLEVRDGWALATCDCIIGHGQPDLGSQCPARQREYMAHRVCQVCAESIDRREDCVFVGRGNLRKYVEPPLHVACAVYSLQVCPGITRRSGVGVSVTRAYRCLAQWEYGPPPHGDGDVEHHPVGRIPLQVQMGRRAIWTFNAGRPIGECRMDADEFLAEYR